MHEYLGQEVQPNRVNRLKIATYTVRTLLSDGHIQEPEEELRETKLVWDMIGIANIRRRGEYIFIALQSGHLLYRSMQTTAKQE